MNEFKQVTKAQFYASVGQLNVHPCSRREITEWVMQDGSSAVVGVSTPGYANTWTAEGKTPETYRVVQRLAPRA